MFISLVPSTTSNKKEPEGYLDLIMQKGVLTTLLTLFNPSNTSDTCTSQATLAACYQLTQSILKDRFCASKKRGLGEVGGHSLNMPWTWQLSWQVGKALVGSGWVVSPPF